MNVSARGLDAIRVEEGLRLRAYPDPATGGKPWTIGYGFTFYRDGDPVRPGDELTKAQAEAMLIAMASDLAAEIIALVRVPLTQNQLDALVLFVWNIGLPQFRASTMLRLLIAGDFAGAAEQFERWKYAAGRVNPVLVERRKRERAMFLGEG